MGLLALEQGLAFYRDRICEEAVALGRNAKGRYAIKRALQRKERRIKERRVKRREFYVRENVAVPRTLEDFRIVGVGKVYSWAYCHRLGHSRHYRDEAEAIDRKSTRLNSSH